MAERYAARDKAPLVSHSTEASIHEHFNRIIYRLNQRREELLTEFRERMEEKRVTTASRAQSIDYATNPEGCKEENPIHSKRDNLREEETEVVFECDTLQLENTISVLGQLIVREIISTPDYPALLQPSVSVGKQGRAKGELYSPRGVAVDEKSKLIYVADEGNISVFSMTGEYIDRLCEGRVSQPWGIAISEDNNVFVSDSGSHCVYKFKLPRFSHVTKVGKEGTGENQFCSPSYLTVTTEKSVLVVDRSNDRIVVMDTDRLKHKGYIKHQTMTHPTDVKVNNNKVYILSTKDSPCLHVFSLTGEKLRSLITRDHDGNAQVRRCFSFCFDRKQNILMSDYEAGNIKVFSQEGALLHKLGDTQDRVIKPQGITLTDTNKIICTSYMTIFQLHIF